MSLLMHLTGRCVILPYLCTRQRRLSRLQQDAADTSSDMVASPSADSADTSSQHALHASSLIGVDMKRLPALPAAAPLWYQVLCLSAPQR